MADKFNTLISAYNPCDFGRPAIHRIGDFTWHGEIKNKFDNTREDTKNFIHRNNTARKVYLTLSGALARPSGRDIFSGGDMLVVNSEWTGRMMRERYPDAWIELAYPPVAASFQSVPRENRENGFVCIGRIAPQKRIEDMIEILSEVRRMGHDLHLHVIGGMDGSAYAGLIGKIAENNSGWVHMEGARFGRGKEELLTGHRYALHARRAEPFGISVAETAGAGCITFVPDCGGPPEILGSEPALCYRDKRDAVQKIDRVLRDDELQRRLAAAMPGCALHFSTQHYMDEIRGAVERFRMG